MNTLEQINKMEQLELKNNINVIKNKITALRNDRREAFEKKENLLRYNSGIMSLIKELERYELELVQYKAQGAKQNTIQNG
ncbi:MAG: hypothetical protein KKF48_01615 [Nanoarchaeota archaeon]|nr:hypothetical protein [Nanoarchaeota archaeon]MBU1027718.1 hypothetical protein [Nanoarchaeota archaeon]